MFKTILNFCVNVRIVLESNANIIKINTKKCDTFVEAYFFSKINITSNITRTFIYFRIYVFKHTLFLYYLISYS